jgi:hypothetical protein
LSRPAARAPLSRRGVLAVLLGAGAAAGSLLARTADAAGRPVAEVWKSPSCGCCTGWVEHMRAAGFDMVVHEGDPAAVRASLGVPEALASCHTAVVEGYVLEGHVPAADVRRLLAQRPEAAGLAVPGMPMDAPGMDGRTGEPYEVILFGGDGAARIFALH